MRTNAGVTIFNKYYDPITKKDLYYKVYLEGVFWDSIKAVNVIKSGLSNASSLRLFIPFSVNSGYKQYVPFKEFRKMEDKSCFWTLQTGDKIVKDLADFEYAGNIAELEKCFDNVLTITSIDTKDFGSKYMWHWEVGAV